jgi:hypothetical protein
MSDCTLKVDWCSRRAAEYAVMHWHYSRKMPASKSNYIGVWEDGRFIGALIFGQGATPQLGKPYGLKIQEICELLRVALTDHRTPVSKIMSIATKFIRNKNPKLRMVVSFADPRQNHHGGIYQAANWKYLGRSADAMFYKLLDGTIHHPRLFSGRGFNGRPPQKLPKGAVLVKMPGKHRYAIALDRSLRTMLDSRSLPYPKRVGSADSGTPGVQPGGGGAIPTSTLHSAQE